MLLTTYLNVSYKYIHLICQIRTTAALDGTHPNLFLTSWSICKIANIELSCCKTWRWHLYLEMIPNFNRFKHFSGYLKHSKPKHHQIYIRCLYFKLGVHISGVKWAELASPLNFKFDSKRISNTCLAFMESSLVCIFHGL